MPAKSATLEQVMDLIREGQGAARERHEDLKSDFEAKHKENVDRRHSLMGKVEAVQNEVHNQDGRIRALETQLVSVIGDNSGGSGLLHEIDRKVDSLTGEVAAIKKTVEDTPKINRWIYAAMGVVALLIVAIPIVVTIVFEILKIVSKN